MLEMLKEHFKKYSFLGPKEVATIIDLSRFKSYKQGDVVFDAGDVNYNMYGVLKGLLRSHVVNTNGEERTVFLVSEGMVVSSSRTFAYGQESIEKLTAIEDSWVAVIDYRLFQQKAEQNLKLQRFSSEMLKQNLVEAVERIEFHTLMSPQERYLKLMERRPQLAQRVPQIYLASYLGVTPVSLSRIRRRVAQAMKNK